MQISINPPTFMWFTTNALVHLTDENPGPIEIDFEEFDKENQKLIILGIRNKQITCSESEAKLLAIYNPQDKVANYVQSSVNQDAEDSTPVFLPEDELKKTASTKLNSTATNIKKFVNANDNIRLLRIMLELERNTRNRKGVASNIELKLNNLASQIHSNIQKENTSIVAIPPDPLADNFSITESETEERSVEIER